MPGTIIYEERLDMAIYYCRCRILDREENEEQRDWLKRCMCMFHWMQTDYYKAKLERASSSNG